MRETVLTTVDFTPEKTCTKDIQPSVFSCNTENIRVQGNNHQS